jgi:hypothetical protein
MPSEVAKNLYIRASWMHNMALCAHLKKSAESYMVNLPQRKKEKYMGAFYLYKPRLHICLDSPAFLCIPRLKQHSQQATQDGTPTYLAQTAPLLVLCYTWWLQLKFCCCWSLYDWLKCCTVRDQIIELCMAMHLLGLLISLWPNYFPRSSFAP